MRRYKFLAKEGFYQALNKLRAAFLAAKDGTEVEEIIKGILTSDERVKIGRRIQIAQMLQDGRTYEEIKDALKVGLTTINTVEKQTRAHPQGFALIDQREDKVESEFHARAYRKVGGSTRVFKKTVYTGFSRKNVLR